MNISDSSVVQILLVNVIVDSFLGLLPIAFVMSDKNISKIVCLVYKENDQWAWVYRHLI